MGVSYWRKRMAADNSGVEPVAPFAAQAPAKRRKKGGKHGETLIDDVLDQLLTVATRPAERQDVDLPEDTILWLCDRALAVFAKQPILLELDAPLSLCGDIHGQYHDLLKTFGHCGFPPEVNYLFLGDYVDRGKRSLETLSLLFAYKIKFPENFFLLRGNHESPSISRIYGFFDECRRRYNVKVWKTCCDVFNYLPVCAVIQDRVICMHGGLSQEMLDETGPKVRARVSALPRPAEVPDSGFLCDLLWADPTMDAMGFGMNDRGVSVAFGQDVVKTFLAREDFDLVVRAHQVVEDGYEFFADRSLVTIFTAPNYCGEFDNAAAVLSISPELLCSFKVLKPELVPVPLVN